MTDQGWIHPRDIPAEVRRELTASAFDRFARAHEKVAASGYDVIAQRQGAQNARNAARKIRETDR